MDAEPSIAVDNADKHDRKRLRQSVEPHFTQTLPRPRGASHNPPRAENNSRQRRGARREVERKEKKSKKHAAVSTPYIAPANVQNLGRTVPSYVGNNKLPPIAGRQVSADDVEALIAELGPGVDEELKTLIRQGYKLIRDEYVLYCSKFLLLNCCCSRVSTPLLDLDGILFALRCASPGKGGPDMAEELFNELKKLRVQLTSLVKENDRGDFDFINTGVSHGGGSTVRVDAPSLLQVGT